MKECCKCKKEIEEEKEICNECKEKELIKWKKINKVLSILQIIFAIIIIVIAIIIYQENNCDNNTDFSSIKRMDTQEIQAFNAQWYNYEGYQTGIQIKSMINRLIVHSHTYQEDLERIIELEFINEAGNTSIIEYNNDLTNFIEQLRDLYTKIEPKKRYNVTCNHKGTELIKKINIEQKGGI